MNITRACVRLSDGLTLQLAGHLNDMTCNISIFRCDSKEQPRDRTLETNVLVCVVLSCSLGNRQQQEKKSLGIIGQRFYPL